MRNYRVIYTIFLILMFCSWTSIRSEDKQGNFYESISIFRIVNNVYSDDTSVTLVKRKDNVRANDDLHLWGYITISESYFNRIKTKTIEIEAITPKRKLKFFGMRGADSLFTDSIPYFDNLSITYLNKDNSKYNIVINIRDKNMISEIFNGEERHLIESIIQPITE